MFFTVIAHQFSGRGHCRRRKAALISERRNHGAGVFKTALAGADIHQPRLGAGEVGYLITGVKDVRQARVGDTVTSAARPAAEPLAGYDHPRPMVFSGLYPVEGDDYPQLRDALDKLRLNDAALVYEPETSTALGFGFRCGFLGLLHMEIVRERLEREFDLDADLDRAERGLPGGPGVRRRAHGDQPERVPGREGRPRSSSRWCAPRCSPPRSTSARSWSCASSRRGTLLGMDYLSADRVEIRYTLPLAEIIFDFFDQLKSRTRGYASLDYEPVRRAGG